MHNAIHPDDFRRLCGHFATGVTIVTVLDATGVPTGMTANSFASVSLDPPLVSVAIDHVATILPAMRLATHFTINILERDQELLSRRFADSRDDRFDGVGWTRDGEQVILEGTLAHLWCEVAQRIDVGDHTLFIGRVIGGGSRHGHPLIHYRGGYADLEPA